MASGDHKGEGYDFTWLIKNASLSFLNSEELIYSPDFQTNFLSTEWTFFIKTSLSDGYLNIYVQRNIDKGPESIQVLLRDVKLDKMVDKSVVKLENPLELTFGKGDAFPVIKFPYSYEDVVQISSYHAEDEASFHCCLCPFSDIYHAGALDELSSHMKTLFLEPEFYDASLCVNSKQIPFHQAILEARTSDYRLLHWKRKLSKVKDSPMPVWKTEDPICDIFQFLYSAQIRDNLLSGVVQSKFNNRSNLAEAKKCLKLWNSINKCLPEVTSWFASTTIKTENKFLYININRLGTEKSRTLILDVGETGWSFESNLLDSRFEVDISVNVCQIEKAPAVDHKFRAVVSLQNASGGVISSVVSYGSINSSISCKKLPKINLNLHDETSISCPFLCISVDIWTGKINSTPKPKWTELRPILDLLVLSKDLLRLFETEAWADVKIIVPDGEFRVHKAILCARSPVFSRMFNTDMKEKSSGVVIITDLSKSVMAQLLKYIYSGQMNLEDIEETIQLAYAADKYLMVSLRNECLKYLRNQYDKKFVLDTYVAFDLFQCDELKAGYEEFIRYVFKRNPQINLDDFKNKFPSLFRKLFVK